LEHLLASRGVLFASYYIQFIFPMQDHLTTYGCFYDLILGEEAVCSDDQEFYYSHITNITSEIEYDILPQKVLERLPGASREKVRELTQEQPAPTDKAGKPRVLKSVVFSLHAAGGQLQVTLVSEDLRESLFEKCENAAESTRQNLAKPSVDDMEKRKLEERLQRFEAELKRLKSRRGLVPSDIAKRVRSYVRDKQQAGPSNRAALN
jgi:hypothetical protein